jgi:anti-sigma factor RsiW
MTVATPIAQALAYVDGCLPADQRREFERSLATDKGLAASLEQWRLQNEAIRRTFGDKALNPGRGHAERASAPPLADVPPLGRDLPRRRETLGRDLRAQVVVPHERSRVASRAAIGRRLARAVAAALAAIIVLASSAAPTPTDPSPQLAAAFSAYRTYALAAQPEFAAVDVATLERWLRPQLGGWVAVPDLGAGGFALVGGRVVPGAQGPGGFVLYRNSAGARLGLTLESSETPPRASARTSGVLIAAPLVAPAPEEATLVAPADAADLAHLVEVARFSAAPAR